MKKTEVDIDVAKWINEHLKKKGWTQTKLAEELDVSQPLINHWVKGRQRPNAEMREKLVEVFGAGFGEEETFGRTLGEWLRSKREKQKLTIKELADKTGLSWLGIKNIEDGNIQSPHKATLKSLEKVLGKLPAVQSKDVEEARDVGGFDFEGTFDVKEWESNAKPGEKIQCIYVIYDKSNRPVYIGQTNDLRSRFKNHEREFWWKEPIAQRFAYIVVKDSEFRKKAEKVMIKLVGTHALMNEQHASWQESEEES